MTPYNPYFHRAENGTVIVIVIRWHLSGVEASTKGHSLLICKSMRCPRRNYIFFLRNHRVFLINTVPLKC